MCIEVLTIVKVSFMILKCIKVCLNQGEGRGLLISGL